MSSSQAQFGASVVRTPTLDDLDAILEVDSFVFAERYNDEQREIFSRLVEPGRLRVAEDDGRIVGVAGSYAFDLTMPGGSTAPTAGVTWVGVLPTHRRRGLLRSLLGAVLDDAEARGETMALLTATESSIYGRFGFGPATEARRVKVDPRLVSLTPGARALAAAAGPLDLRRPAAARGQIEAIWDRYRRQTPGELNRVAARWDYDEAEWSGRFQEPDSRVLVAANGYAVFSTKEPEETALADQRMTLHEIVATDLATHLALWDLVLQVDLVTEVDTWQLTLGDPLLHHVTDPRQFRTVELTDHYWARPLDLHAAIAARAFEGDGEVTIGVAGDPRGRLDGVYRLQVVDGVGALSPAPAPTPAELDLPFTALGPLLLAGHHLDGFVTAGRLAENVPGATRTLRRLLGDGSRPFGRIGF